jgi:hypothetical protein
MKRLNINEIKKTIKYLIDSATKCPLVRKTNFLENTKPRKNPTPYPRTFEVIGEKPTAKAENITINPTTVLTTPLLP